jgi:hypothetical protein
MQRVEPNKSSEKHFYAISILENERNCSSSPIREFKKNQRLFL